MKNTKDLLKIASGINCVIAAINILFNSTIIGIIYGVLSIILWIISEVSDEKIASYRDFLTVLGIILFFSNLLSCVLVLIAVSNIKNNNPNSNTMNAPPKKIIKKVIDPEIRKIDILLKLGVGMVLISGILFATTSWQSISMELKAIALLFLGCLFLFLSFFTEKRLKLYMTTYMYWLLSMSFFALTIVGALYFGMFNPQLTYIGIKNDLAFAITFLTISGLSFATYLKFSKDYLAYTSYFSILSMIWFLLNAILPVENSIIIYFLILFLCNLLNKKNNLLLDVTKTESYCTFLLILTNLEDTNSIMIFISCIINMINLYYLSYMDKKNSIIQLILIYVLSIIGIFKLEISIDYQSLLLFIFTTLHTLLASTFLSKQSKDYYHVNYIFYSICSVICFFIVNENYKDIAFIIPTIFLLLNILLSMDIQSIEKVEFAPYFGPVSILALVYSIIQAFTTNEISFQYIIIITTLIYCLINLLMKKANIKLLYQVAISIGIIVSLENNIFVKEAIPSLLTIILSAYLLLISFQERNEKKWILLLSYILLLICLYSSITIVNVLQLNTLLSSLIMIWMIVVMVLLFHDENIKKVSLFSIIIPLYDIVRFVTTDPNYRMIMISILTLYVVFLLVIYLCKDKESKNILGTIGIVVAILEVITIPTLSIGIYVGIVGLGVILLGYYFSKELPAFFITGIVITIINIIYQLKELWEKIPFWLYLLLGGLSLLFFVTYKEITKSKKK